MFARERLIVHFVTQQCLRMQDRGHIDGFVIVIGAAQGDESSLGIGADQCKKI
jgi:hypothetical protein